MAEPQATASLGMQKDIDELEQLFRSDASPEVVIPLAETYLRRGFPLRAIEVCQKGLQRSDNPACRLLLARAYFDASFTKRSYLQQAAQEADTLVRQDPGSWEAHGLKGEIALELDDTSNAVASLRQAYELNPSHPQARMLLKSLGHEIEEIEDGHGPYHIDVETGFFATQDDSFLKVFRDVFAFFAVILAGVYLYANNSILQNKVRALIILGRTQQNLDTYGGLKKATQVYKTILDQFDKAHPYALIHLSEAHYSLYRDHERTQENYDKFKNYFVTLQQAGQTSLLNQLASYHCIVVLIGYDRALKMQAEGKMEEADQELNKLDAYLKQWIPSIALHPRINWLHGLIYEKLRNNRFARANLQRATELGWNNPTFRNEYAWHYLRTRDFQKAHEQFKPVTELGQQGGINVQSELSEASKQQNAYCWIDPPLLMGASAPVGQRLSVFDLLEDSIYATLKATTIPSCSFHPALQEHFKGNTHYLMASIGDALSVLDSGVGMSVAYDMIADALKEAEKVKGFGDLSPHIEAWLHFVEAKQFWYQNEYKKAREKLDMALKKVDYEALFYSLDGMLYAKENKWEEAWKSIQKAIRLSPHQLQIYYEGFSQLAAASDAEGKPSQAEKASLLLDSVKKYAPESDTLFYLSGVLTFRKGDIQAAVDLWKKAIEKNYYHYDANLEIGKIRLKAGNEIRPETDDKGKTKVTYTDLADLHKRFVSYKEKALAKFKERVVKEDDRKKEIDEFEKYLSDIKEGKKPVEKLMNKQVLFLAELYDEDAGAYIEQAMQIRPGAAEPRFWLGELWRHNKRWADSKGHLDVAMSGYLRDLDFENAKKASKSLLEVLVKAEKEESDGVTQASNFFKQKIMTLIRQEAVPLKAEKEKLTADGKLEEATRVRGKPAIIERSARTIQTFADVLKEDKNFEELAGSLKEYAELLQKQGFLEVEKKLEAQAKADAEAQKEGGGKKPKKGKKGRR